MLAFYHNLFKKVIDMTLNNIPPLWETNDEYIMRKRNEDRAQCHLRHLTIEEVKKCLDPYRNENWKLVVYDKYSWED